jgi:SAM-dependent methyltransferase
LIEMAGVMAVSETPSAPCPLPDLSPETYARWRATELGPITEDLQHDLMLHLIGNVTRKKVLEIGCGDGKLAVELSRRGAYVTGIDASKDMIDAARRRADAGGVHVDLRVASAQSLPFPEAEFDVVVAVTVLCFVEDATPAFAEIARVLKPGSRLVIGELNKWSTWASERRVRAWLGSALWKRGRFRTPRELRALAGGAGLEPGRVIGANFYPRSARAARLMKPFDARLGRLTTFGAAFVALVGTKPTAA